MSITDNLSINQKRIGLTGNIASGKSTIAKYIADSKNLKVLNGSNSYEEILDFNTDLVMAAITGSAGLLPVVSALKKGLSIALANKERETPEYIQMDEKNKKFKFVRVPKFEEVPYPIVMEPNLVIEYYSR